MAEEVCACDSRSVLVFPCSGGSNVGQMANAAAVEMTRRGQAKLYCLAGVGAHVAGMVDSTRHADYRIALDGCNVACARKVLEHAGLPVDRAVVVTELGFAKNHDFEWPPGDVERIISASGAPSLDLVEESACGCGCGCPSG